MVSLYIKGLMFLIVLSFLAHFSKFTGKQKKSKFSIYYNVNERNNYMETEK